MDASLQPAPEDGAEVATEPRGDTVASPSAPAGSALGLRELEAQVDALIEECDRLREENVALKKRQDTLAGECARLVERSEAVRSRVETMIARLRAMEGS